MRAKLDSLTAEYVRSIIAYDAETGEFKRVARGRGIRVGPIGFDNGSGYRAATIQGRRYMLHRVAFLIMEGRWPVGDIDHQDGNRSNNAWSNLREATASENCQNRRLRKDNETGIKGVGLNTKRNAYQALIMRHGKHVHLGYYPTPEAAAYAYRTASSILHGEFSRHNHDDLDLPELPEEAAARIDIAVVAKLRRNGFSVSAPH